MSDPVNQEVAKFQRYKELRSEITYEAHLAVSRTTWSIASQAFLFTSLATGVKATDGSARLDDSLLFPLVPFVGIVISILTLVSVYAALRKASQLSDRIRRRHKKFVEDYQVESGWTARLGIASTFGIPATFILAWLVILFYR